MKFVMAQSVFFKIYQTPTPLVAAFFCMISLPAFAQSYMIDVRTTLEYKLSHVDNAMHMPHQDIVKLVKEKGLKKDDELLLYCRSGNRAGKAKSKLELAGFTKVKNLKTLDKAAAYKKNTCNTTPTKDYC